MRTLTSSLSAAVAVFLAIGCNSGTSHDLDSPANAAPDPTPSSVAGDAGADGGPTVINRTEGSTKPAFQTQSAAQLRAVLAACLGSGADVITSDMIVGGGGAGFLSPSFAVTAKPGADDVVTQQLVLFDGNSATLQRGTRVDALTLEYVTALRNVGNVAGTRCLQNKTSDPSLCACGTLPQATAMLKRCLPYLNPTTNEALSAAQMFQAKCATDPGAAIASLVASAAFAKLP